MFVMTMTKRKLIRAVMFVLVLITGIAIGVFAILSSIDTGAENVKLPIYNVKRTDNKISITFDCAWGNSNTDKLISILAEADALPIAAESIDLVILAHALDFSASPQLVLREAARVLEPEGRLVLTAFNPLGLWWLRQRFVSLGARPYLPTRTMPISVFRLRDWFALLGLEIDIGRFGIYSPGLRAEKRLRRWAWLDKAGDRWAPQFSNLYLLSAVKRRPGTRLIHFSSVKKHKQLPAGSLPAASSSSLPEN